MLAVLLAIGLVFAQWAGLGHRIAHAPLSQERVIALSASAAGDPESGGAYHSCLIFDAATLGASLHTPPFAALPPAARCTPLPALPFLSWMAPFAPQFSSRAPPA